MASIILSRRDQAPHERKNLLDLPTELFGEIIKHFVDNVGIAHAWYVRTVCKTFRFFLSDAIFTQPLEAFRKPSKDEYEAHQRILWLNFETFVMRHIQSPDYATAKISSTINGIVDALLHILPEVRICEVMRQQYIQDIMRGIFNTRRRFMASYTRDYYLTAFPNINPQQPTHGLTYAAAVGNIRCAEYYIMRGACLWGYASPGLHTTPLDAACRTGKVEMVEFLLGKLRQLAGSGDLSSLQRHMGKAITIALEYRQSECFEILARSWLNLLRLSNEQLPNHSLEIGDWGDIIYISGSIRNLDIWRNVLGGTACRGLYNHLNDTSAPHFLDWDVGFQAQFSRTIFGSNLNQTLGYAVRQSNRVVTRLLIQHGADVNSGFDSKTPLQMAISKNNFHMVTLLVENGAKVDASVLGQMRSLAESVVDRNYPLQTPATIYERILTALYIYKISSIRGSAPEVYYRRRRKRLEQLAIEHQGLMEHLQEAIARLDQG